MTAKVAIALLTKDKPELTRRSIEPLLQPGKFDLFQVDGSVTEEGKEFALQDIFRPSEEAHLDIRGGPDAAIVYALTMMLNSGGNHSHVGIVEQDVLLAPDWFDDTMALFSKGHDDGLEVGAVSARAYEDRVLCQRDGYALMHNLGAGNIIFTRKAARLVLDNYRSTWSTDNRLIFSQLSGVDIGRYWAFRGSDHWLTADWGFDAILARHGLASLALTPSRATMLDQDIAEFGLRMSDGRSSDFTAPPDAFDSFVALTRDIRMNICRPGISGQLQFNGAWNVFPHQVAGLGGSYSGDWRLKWSQAFGPFSWQARDKSRMETAVLGPCDVLIGGGESGGKAKVVDYMSGFTADPDIAPEAQMGALTISVPGGCTWRTIALDLSPGCVFYGLRTLHPQPWSPDYRFDYSCLPSV